LRTAISITYMATHVTALSAVLCRSYTVMPVVTTATANLRYYCS
jgi:hypothetical protein